MRLNREIKQKILDSAIAKSTLISEASALVSERAEIAEKLRRQFVSKENEREVVESIERLKRLNKKTGIEVRVHNHEHHAIQINVNGWAQDINFSGFEYGIWSQILKKFNNRKEQIYKIISPDTRYVITDDCGLSENEKKRDDLLSRYYSLTTQVNAILSKCNTDGQLLKLWPESAELIPKDKVKPSTALMVKTDELNAILALPSNNSQN